MASYQRVALYIFFDALERDLVSRLRVLDTGLGDAILTEEERQKASRRLQARGSHLASSLNDFDILFGLDLGDKLQVLMRNRDQLDQGAKDYFSSKFQILEKSIPVRNAVMHGRPLTTEEYALGFATANDLIKAAAYWPSLYAQYTQFSSNPSAFIATSISLLDDELNGEVLNNLPIPDYDDTGFFPRPNLEKDLKRRLLGRHPVVTVLGEGGNGKTALALQTLYGLVNSNDHPFDAIVWVTAKSSRLTAQEIVSIEGAIEDSLGVFKEIADQFEPGDQEPLDRVRKLLAENKILLAIDNLETVIDESIREFALDVPGESKLLLTSRIPLGSDLAVTVGEFSPKEAKAFLHRVIEAYDVRQLRSMKADTLARHIERLGFKPLLLKWFALGVQGGLNAERITSEPQLALKFCLENVVEQLSENGKFTLMVLSQVPRPIAASVLQYITDLTATDVEIGLTELMRFGLVESNPFEGQDSEYQVRPFARSYMSKLQRDLSGRSRDILQRYRSIEGLYQNERGRSAGNRYDPKTYTVRSPSEAISARKLRHAVSLALKERFEEAFLLISELKVSSPAYFEVYRTEAFISFRSGDAVRASQAYEVAIDLAPDQPQLLAAYAGFLTRSMGDYAAAAETLEKALHLDSDSSYLLREAARTRFFLYEFESAQELIDIAWNQKRPSIKEDVVIHDLQVQLFTRAAEFCITKGDPKSALESIKKLRDFINISDSGIFDRTLLEHLWRALPIIDSLKKLQTIIDQEEIVKIEYDIKSVISNRAPATIYEPPLLDDIGVPKSGSLKVNGRRENFGFIVDAFGAETFVARADVEAVVWADMCRGRAVTFSLQTDMAGRPRASNVRLL